MFFQILISILLGIFVGVITGLLPGIHTNLVAAILLSFSAFLLEYSNPLNLSAFIVSVGITHSFVDLIPSIFFGAPDSESVMIVLPGHELLLRGFGFEAVKLAATGALLSSITAIIILPIFFFSISFIYKYVKEIIPFAIIALLIFLFSKEKNILFAVLVFVFSGILGLISLDKFNEPLLPLFSGIFGASGIILSMLRKENIPRQQKTDLLHLKNSELGKTLLGSILSSAFIILFPTLGPSQASALFSSFFKDIKSYSYLVFTAGISSVDFLFSLAALFTIDKARNGAVEVISELIKLNLGDFIVIVLVVLIVCCIATILTLNLASIFVDLVNKINYFKINIFILLFIFIIVFFISGSAGVLLLIVSTLLGFLAPLLNVSRSNAMGCLIIPFLIGNLFK